MIRKTKAASGMKGTQHLNMTDLEALVATRGRSVFLEKPSTPGFVKQEDTSGRKNLVAGIITFKSEPNAARGSAHLFHRVNRAKHVRSTGTNDAWVRALNIGLEAIKSLIAGPVLRSPNRAPTSGSQRDAGNQNLNFGHILVEHKVSKTRWAKLSDKSQ